MSDTGILISLDNEDAFRSRVVLDYTSRDFTAIRTQLVGLARGLMPEWETAGEAPDFGTLLLELISARARACVQEPTICRRQRRCDRWQVPSAPSVLSSWRRWWPACVPT